MGWVKKFREGLEVGKMYQAVEEYKRDLWVEPGTKNRVFKSCSFLPGQKFGSFNIFIDCEFSGHNCFGDYNAFYSSENRVESISIFSRLRIIGSNNSFGDYNVFYCVTAETRNNTFGRDNEFVACRFGNENKFGEFSVFSRGTRFGYGCEFGDFSVLSFSKPGDNARFGKGCVVILTEHSKLSIYSGSPRIIIV